MDKMITTQEFMEMFNFSERQVKALYKTEDFPVIKIGYKYFTPETSFQEWLSTHKEVYINTNLQEQI